MPPADRAGVPDLADLAEELARDVTGKLTTTSTASAGRRFVLGIAGPPAAGKSTLAAALTTALDHRLGAAGAAAYLPLDGFHLSNAQLERLGLRHCKGAPATFDVHGYAHLLGRAAVETGHPVYAPDFDRVLDEPVAARHVVHPHARVVVTEGNYLALDEPGWTDARAAMDELWYVDTEDAERESRLVARHTAHGRDAVEAREFVEASDRPNGELIKAESRTHTRVIRL